ncbi:MAG TPA: HAMP domain-containing sensor histidine kinase [Dehalococcoidia bacterium]|jgi:signal transduction histidine kinase|nr:HAMP domain-containing sensor histidine kinase [Dehalococcoidia bacterium]
MPRLRSFLFSIQTKLVLAMTAVIVLAILLAGTVFVARSRNDRKEAALNRIVAESPAIYNTAIYYSRNQNPATFYSTLDKLSQTQNVRILLLSTNNTVLHDTGHQVDGKQIAIPSSRFDDRRGYVSWESRESMGSSTTLITATTFLSDDNGIPFRIVLAVQNDTITSAWLGVLPGLGLAALVAIALASLAAFLFARQISQPLRKLDLASRALAAGDFEQRVEVDRDDEVGRLARSFSTMAERVGERDTQMRTLLANVSHDLKTPMTSITGYAQALTDGTADSDDVHRVGTVIREEAEHVNRLLADLLYLGEIDAGQVLTREEDVPLDSVVARCVRRVEPGAQAKRLDMRVDVADDALVPNTDPDKLERALTNVLENATKFTPEGGNIEVRGWRENGRLPARVYCSVRNSGAAIPEDDLPRLFDRFFRGDRARRTASGSGLGLAISRQLLQLNGGDITARNDGDGHVVFTLSLRG